MEMFQIGEASRDGFTVTVGLQLECSEARTTGQLFFCTRGNLRLVHKFDVPGRFKTKLVTLKIDI